MLLPLLHRFPDNVRVSLFHTPHLCGLLCFLVPERFNETIAAYEDLHQTNQQDHYVLFQGCSELADFFSDLVGAVSEVSLQLQSDDTVETEEGMEHHYEGDKTKYCEAASMKVMRVIEDARHRQYEKRTTNFQRERSASSIEQPDTWMYPLVQIKPFGIQIDELVTETLLTEAVRGDQLYLTTGYFNLTQGYMDLLLGTRANYNILLAAPEVNGFFGAIPAAYVYIEHQFYNEVCRHGQQIRVKIQEYYRDLWNFMLKEQQQLYNLSNAVSPATFQHPSRYVKLWVKLVTPLIKNFF
ncbi:hypothetical protein XELAEV_18043662mg [Xenopus laevis]|uniref:CDP-diacylglycerol--glycerol-3-phosphate 3-phosphatidyltransferase n=1 Tax=Xenopus laevis TaxID=8355 RepID=A0A974BX15_XENLA|nr:hypothetical protein XELAEV_18043662mg [Xenopus laevis]